MIAFLGVILMIYTMVIRPFTTDTKINDPRMDNLYWYLASLFLIILGLMFGI